VEKVYMMFRALAKNVHIKGRVRMHTPPITWYSPKNAITETIKRSQ
jgi:hypothetical protein